MLTNSKPGIVIQSVLKSLSKL